MKRLKYILIPMALLIGLIVVLVGCFSAPIEPGLRFDKTEAVKADWEELLSNPEEHRMDKVFIEGEVRIVFVDSNGDCSLEVKDDDSGYIIAVYTDTLYRRYVQPICCRLSEGDRVKVWGYFFCYSYLPRPGIGACVMEKIK